MERDTQQRIDTFVSRLAALPPEKRGYVRGKLDDLFEKASKRNEKSERKRKDAN